MSKVDVLQLVQDLSQDQADAASIEKFYDDIVLELAQQNVLTQVTLLTAAANDTSFSNPANAVNTIAVFWDDRQLSKAKRQELEWRNMRWRDERGTPEAWVTEDETEKTFRLYPVPDYASKALAPIFGGPLGKGYAENSVAVVHSEKRDDVIEYLELPIALEIMHREFTRESAHRQTAFAGVCLEIAKVLYQMVGVIRA